MKTIDKTVEGNKIIAVFDGMQIGKLSGWLSGNIGEMAYRKIDGEIIEAHSFDKLKYHSSWDWLQSPWNKCYEKLIELNTEASLGYIEKMKEAMIRSDIKKSFEIMVSAITFINK